ncbi:hypothetical protein [Desulfovibrio legallii]|uniref:Uncharacterized protein n=1 Tax=Desulfovibrio legallii TaxID=571438 RepID=A0A1G7LTW7_9BACT|nr:hypothetical protein [Desulfovibrio legallii]SDF52957.1 hypothetical protein SAMN05192586_10730 [Desulfovibrio legallii]
MELPYVAHVMEGRARLRHPFLEDATRRAAAQKTVLGQPGVLEARPGTASLLLILSPEADFAAVCAALEAALPELRTPQAEAAASRRAVKRARRAPQTPARSCSALAPFYGKDNRGRSLICGISQRKFEVRSLLGCAAVCLTAGLAGAGRLHVLAGAAWSVLAARHVWVRRKAL